MEASVRSPKGRQYIVDFIFYSLCEMYSLFNLFRAETDASSGRPWHEITDGLLSWSRAIDNTRMTANNEIVTAETHGSVRASISAQATPSLHE